MTTTDLPDDTAAGPTAPPPTRTLRRAREGRVGAGVAGGLGRYFDVDPVLFRVLFATSAFFGGAGIIAYLLAWAAIPEEGTEKAPIDGWMAELRRRKVPLWVVIGGGALLIWAIAFSWWVPGPFFPVLVVIVLLVAYHGRRGWQHPQTPPPPAPPVDLTKNPTPPAVSPRPGWMDDAVAWFREARAAALERKRRARPVQFATVGVLAAAMAALALVDTLSRIPMQTYFWVALGILALGLLTGAVLRRFPADVTPLLIPAVVGAVAFAGTSASFSDGLGERTWTPTSTPAAHYRLAFGQGELDLRKLPAQDTPRVVRVDAAAGQIRVFVPRRANVRVEANVRFGQIDIRDGGTVDKGNGGVRVNRVVPAPAGASGAPVVVAVHVAEGQIEIVRR